MANAGEGKLGMKVRVSRQDYHSAEILAKDTVFLLERIGVKPRLENPNQSRKHANFKGFLAEYAVCRLFNAESPRLNISTDGGVDLWVNGISIDVKYSKANRLIFDSEAKFQSDVAVLVTDSDEDDCMNIIGWSSKNGFLANHHKHDFGYGERLVLDAKYLQPIETLWRKLQEREFR